MGLEAGGTGIVGLNSSNPATGDNVSQGDDHIRLVKAELLRDFPNFVASTPVTATQTELNILDGATLTVTELNTLDASAQAVTGFTYSNIVYIDDDGDSQGANIFDIGTNIGAAWESVGPTGSGATNIWTALDALPANTKWVGLRIVAEATINTGTSTRVIVYGRRNGSSSANGIATQLAECYQANSTGAAILSVGTVNSCIVPVTNKIFDLYASITATSKAVYASLESFGV